MNEISEISRILRTETLHDSEPANEAIKTFFESNLTSENMEKSAASIVGKIELRLFAAVKKGKHQTSEILEERLRVLKEALEGKRAFENENLLILYLKQAELLLNERRKSGGDSLFACSVLKTIKDRVKLNDINQRAASTISNIIIKAGR